MLKQWVKARSYILGNNDYQHDYYKGIQLASQCSHKEAQLVVAWSKGKTEEAFIDHLREIAPTEPTGMALFFLAYANSTSKQPDYETYCSMIHEAARRGYALAQGCTMQGENLGKDMVRASAAQGEPVGLYQSARLRIDINNCLDLVKRAAALGWVQAQYAIVVNSGELVERLYWYRKLARHGYRRGFVEEVVRLQSSNQVIPTRLLYNVYQQCYRIRDDGFTPGDVIKKCAANYVHMLDVVREACFAWLLCAKRMAGGAGHPLCKDVRTKIAMLVWANRKEFNFPWKRGDTTTTNV